MYSQTPPSTLPLGFPNPTVRQWRLYELGFDLRKPGQNYQALNDFLDEANALRIQQSLRWIPTQLNAYELRDIVNQLIDKGDSVNIVEMAGEVAGYESRPEVRAWIERYLQAFRRN